MTNVFFFKFNFLLIIIVVNILVKQIRSRENQLYVIKRAEVCNRPDTDVVQIAPLCKNRH